MVEMKEFSELTVGDVVEWEGKKYKVVLDHLDFGCKVCDLYESCSDIPYDCTLGDDLVHFEEN